MIELKVASLSDQGRHREINEDSVLTDPPLLAVADGMGGHVAGEVASSLALEVLGGWKDKIEDASGEAGRVLREAFEETNRAVYEKGQSDPSLTGMGTTLTAVWIQGSKVTFAHVGDSRAYLLRNGGVRQVTEDQTKAQELVKQGVLSSEEAVTSRDRHILMQAVGVEPDVGEVDTFTLEVYTGDRLLLATDGLSDMIPSNERLAEILTAHPDPQEACRALVDEANKAGGHDNISVVVIDVTGDGPAAPAAAEDAEETSTEEAGPGETGELPAVAEPSASDGAEPQPSRGRLPRLAIVGGLVLVALVAAVVLTRPSGPSYVLASRGNSVVVLDGRPGQGDQAARGDVVEVFSEPRVDEFAVPAREALRNGIEVDSLADARRVVQTLPKLLGPQDPVTPTPSPATSPTPEPPEDGLEEVTT